ncbi:AraC family transcriptional regulator [Cohnella sp. LGH]|uniref:AraC family transcriptional regulator n=1 Tax=Cohnella sp. LGH TaxID=1619153 RepID=UPI001ADB9FEA|nr:AraC family transcriptional regulator [Cohnella sp. LGH]QTH43188.1 AraC family transcriptional regulator [Cohnella sp. LGH]
MEREFGEHFITTSLPGRPIRLYYCGYHRCPSGHGYGPAMRDHVLLHYIRSGKGKFQVNNTSYELKNGDCFVLFPNVPGAYRADEDEPWQYVWVGFDPEAFGAYLTAAGLTEEHPTYSFREPGRISDLFERMFEGTSDESFIGEADGIGHLFRFFACLMEETSQSSVALGSLSKRDADESVQQAIRFIRSNYSRPLTVADLASHVGLERSYFSKRFRARIGKSPHDFLTRYRMEQAARMLIHTRVPVGTIAASVGFGDLSYFSKAFRKHHGASPGVFREQHRERH